MRPTYFFQKTGCALLAAFALCLLSAPESRANPTVYEKALGSTGWVIVPSDAKSSSLGTCWVVDRGRRLAITCRHIVGKAREALVYFPCSVKGEVMAESRHYLHNVAAIPARIIASDEAKDLALLQLEAVPDGVKALPLAPRSARPGEVVHSVGNAGLGEGMEDGTLWWYTRGNVRQIHRRKVKTSDGPGYVRLLQTQSPVNQGDSGGPVLNDQGQLVGVTHGFEADVRLVSDNIDVQEVKAFLSRSLAAPGELAVWPEPGLRGGWTFSAPGPDGKTVRGEGEFRGDGTFVLSSAQDQKTGRYAFANGVLWLIFDEAKATGCLAWSGKDRFTLQLGETKLAFDRRLMAKVVEGEDPR